VKRQKNGIQEAVYQYDGDDRSFGSSDDIYTRYAFDYTGRTINATTLNYDQSEILGVTAAAYTTSSGTSATNNRVEKDAQSGQNGINLLQYGGLEPHDGFTGVTSYWTKLSGSTANNNAVVKTGELVRTGSYALKTYVNSSATTKKIGIGQSVSLQANVTYTFSAYVNTQKVTSFDQSGGAYVAFLNSSGTEVATGDKVTYQTSDNIESGWQRVYVTYTPKTAGTYRCVAMQSDAYGSAYFDDLQLEVGSVPSSVNLLQNGNFSVTQTDSSGYTSPVEWTAKNLYIYPRTDDSSNNTSYLWGDAAGMKRGWQEIPIGKEAKDTYLLSGWAYAHSAADTESSLTDTTAENNAKRYFGLIARCNYSDGTKEYFYMPFNDDYVGWQYASCVIVPKQANQSKTLSSITVITAYDCNINGAAFDNLSLRQEPCTTYTYDSKGNVTAVNATSNSSSAFSYAAGTTKLTKSTTGADGTYIYTYDYGDSRNDHLVTKITNDNVSMNITYDAMGNSTGTVLKSDSSTSAKQLQTSATYSTDGSQLLSQTNANGQTTKYAYSSNTRMLTATTDAAGTTYTSTYNANNDRANMSYISGVVSVDYGYNKGLLSTIKRGGYLPGDTTTKKSQTYNIGYDSFGNMTSIAVGSRTLASYAYGSNNNNLQSMTYGNGTVVSYTYDNLDRVTEEYWDNTLKYEYSYSAEGYPAKKLDVTTGKAVNYEHDSLGRLIHSYQTADDSIIQWTEHTAFKTSLRRSRKSSKSTNSSKSVSSRQVKQNQRAATIRNNYRMRTV
jgi:YD repeat-containing protein